MTEQEKPDGLRRLWGRRQAFKLRARQSMLFEGLLPRIQITVPPGGPPASIEASSLFFGGDAPQPTTISLEIGFGGGEHLIAWARKAPREGFLGAEPFVNGMAKMLAHIDDTGVTNIRLFAGDARRLVEALTDASLARVFILFPDPWPKKRHHKRRYVQHDTLREIARVLVDGGLLRIASDIPAYIDWTLSHIATHSEFLAVARGTTNGSERPADWPPTRYEQKAREQGRTSTYLEFRRKPRIG